ncbi:MAG TPA: ABC transporter permease [Limnochorda sp.]
MRPWQVIARREFGAVTGGRPYRVVTLLGALLIAALAFTPLLLDRLASRGAGEREPVRLLVAAPLDLFQEMDRLAGSEAPGLPLELRWIGEELGGAGRVAADDRVRSGEVDGWLELAAHPGLEGLRASLTLAEDDWAVRQAVSDLVTPLVLAARAQQFGVAPQVLEQLRRPVVVEARTVGRGEEEARDPAREAIAQILSYALLFGLYMAIIIYGNAISMGIIHEKGNRVVELLVGAVKPIEILVGKVVGIGGAGLLQFCIWMAVGLIFSVPYAASGIAARLGLENLDRSIWTLPMITLAAFTFFFLLGYTLYALLYAAFASTAARPEEANQALMIPMFLVIIGFFIAAVAWAAPASSLAVAGSLIPFFTPFVLFARLVLSAVPAWQAVLGIGLTLVTIALVLLFAARAYRQNLLSYHRVSLWGLFTGRGGLGRR